MDYSKQVTRLVQSIRQQSLQDLGTESPSFEAGMVKTVLLQVLMHLEICDPKMYQEIVRTVFEVNYDQAEHS